MRYLGLGIEESHNPWYGNTRPFTSGKLLDHLVDKVLLHGKTIILPTEAPITAPTSATFQNVGTISRLASEKEQMTVDENDQFKMDGKD